MNRLQRGDLVVVISGKHKGKQGRVKQVLPEDDKVVIEGINVIRRNVRPSPRNPQGGVIEREAALHACKVQPVDPSTGKATRVKIKVDENGNKSRVAKSGAAIVAER